MTREVGWEPTHPDVLADLDEGHCYTADWLYGRVSQTNAADTHRLGGQSEPTALSRAATPGDRDWGSDGTIQLLSSLKQSRSTDAKGIQI